MTLKMKALHSFKIIRHKCGSTVTRVGRRQAFTMQALTVYFGPYDKDGSSVCEREVYSSRHPMSKRTWDTGVVKVIKREKNRAVTLAVGRNAENKEMADSFKVLHSRCWECSRDKMVYSYCSSDIFGSQLFDH
jgi:hypothetical protein